MARLVGSFVLILALMPTTACDCDHTFVTGVDCMSSPSAESCQEFNVRNADGGCELVEKEEDCARQATSCPPGQTTQGRFVWYCVSC